MTAPTLHQWERLKRLSFVIDSQVELRPQADELRVIGGGPISARFVSPKPYGVEPLTRRKWPTRAELLKTKAWSISTR